MQIDRLWNTAIITESAHGGGLKFETGREFYGRIEPYRSGDCFQSYKELTEEFFLI